MFRGFFTLALASLTCALALPPQPPAPVWHNRTTVINPQVNAVNVINDGLLYAAGNAPWDSQNTLNYTNRGTIYGAPGLRFETVDGLFGFRTPAQTFYNGVEILAADSGFGSLVVTNTDGVIFRNLFGYDTSLIKVNAQAVTNEGVMNVGANGFIQIHGRNVDLTSGALIVGDIDDPLSGGRGGGTPSRFDTNFFPATGIYDLAWGIGSFTNARIGGILTSVNPGNVSTPTPQPTLTNVFGGEQSGAIRLDEALLWSREEVVDETNEVVQLIAVQVSDPNIAVLASFTPQTYWDGEPIGGFLSAAVELQVGRTDFRTLERVTNSLYIVDQLGASTNRALMENILYGSFRPGNFVVFRGDTGFFFGEPASTNVREDILTTRLGDPYPIPYLNTDVFTNEWAGYSAEVQSVAAQLPIVPGVAVTNIGGQVEVNAQELLLRNTRIRGEGFVTLTASNIVIGGQNLVDTPRLSLNFGSGTGTLRVNEFVPDSVERFNGTFDAYSTVFTNYYERTNVVPAETSGGEDTIETNTVEVRFQVTIVDARGLQTREPVQLFDMRLTSTNGGGAIFFNENVTVLNDFRIDARELTLVEGSSLTLAGETGLSYTNLINVRYFTNRGSLSLGLFADLQSTETTPYESFYNSGLIAADGVEIWANSFHNEGGVIFSSTLLDIAAGSLRIDGGYFEAFGTLSLSAENATISNLEAYAGIDLVLDVNNSLNDGGSESPNSLTVEGDVIMSGDRPSGNLLGTAITWWPEPLDFVSLFWSSDDRGPNASGFDNNLALGMLTLQAENFSFFEFRPARVGAALYVDVLVIGDRLSQSLDLLTNSVELHMNVYYSEVASTNGAINADSLNRIFGPNAPFNFIRVSGFDSPNLVDVPLSEGGPTSRMNRFLRLSPVIDTDGDGIPNISDDYPLTPADPMAIQLTSPKRTASGISFGLANTGSSTFVIEHTTNLFAPDWKPITGRMSASQLGDLKSFSNSIPPGSQQGYYRVKMVP